MALVRLVERPLVPIEDEAALDLLRSAAVGIDQSSWQLILSSAGSVGRLELLDNPSFGWIGTAFVVAEDVVLTAGHAADLFINGARQFSGRAQIVFDRKSDDARGASVHRVLECLTRHPELDVAALRVDNAAPLPKPLVLHGTEAIAEGTALAVIAYSVLEAQVSGTTRPSATIAPGRFLSFRSHLFGTRGAWVLAHDCTTLGGTAGAPIIDIATGTVVGLHTAGQERIANYGVPAREIVRDSRLRALRLSVTPQSPAADPGALESGSAGTDETKQPGSFQQSRPRLVEVVDSRLRDRFATLDEACDFIAKHGPGYKAVVAAQPGRGKVSDAQFRRAVVQGLARRSLLDQSFLETLGIIDESAPSPASPSPTTPPADPLASGPVVDRVAAAVDGARRRGLHIDVEKKRILFGAPRRDGVVILGGNISADKPGSVEITSEYLADLKARIDTLAPALSQIQKSRMESDPKLLDYSGILNSFTNLGRSWTLALQAKQAAAPVDYIPTSFLREGAVACRSVCIVRRNAAGCTGWLLAPDLVVLPAHALTTLVDASADVASWRVTFEDDPAGFDDAPSPSSYDVAEVMLNDSVIDFAIIRLKTPVPDRAPLQLQTVRDASGPIAIVHHPGLGRRMITLHGAQLLSTQGDEVRYSATTSVGSGGAPIFDTKWQVLGMHIGRSSSDTVVSSGQQHEKRGMSVEALVRGLSNPGADQALWRRVAAAQYRLRSIDPSLMAGDATEQQPVVIQLLDDGMLLTNGDGLSIVHRLGDLVTAWATPACVQRLARTQGVLSVRASRGDGGPECGVSVPFIGVSAVHDQHEKGDKAIIAIIDDGIDPFHRAFTSNDGKSRIAIYWDQTDRRVDATAQTASMSEEGAELVARHGLKGGMLYTWSDIDRMAADRPPALRSGVLHGTAVAGIAAGRSTVDEGGDFTGGVAPAAPLIIVRYHTDGRSIGYSSGHIQALDFIDKWARERDLPVVVNISNGMNAGAHDGSSAVELACTKFTDTSQAPGRVIVKSAGNERNTGRHASFKIKGGGTRQLRWQSGEAKNRSSSSDAQSTLDRVELWFHARNQYRFTLSTPEKTMTYPILADRRVDERLDTRNRLYAHYRQYAPENARSQLVIEIAPGDKDAVQPGEWSLLLQIEKFQVEDEVHAWIERNDLRDCHFKDYVQAEHTITVPGTSPDVITVAAFTPDPLGIIFRDGSMGPTLKGECKPDLIAPGVNIRSARAGSIKSLMPNPESGTSFSAPHVTGAVALALSAASKAGQLGPRLNQSLIRRLLLDTCSDFNVSGSPESGYGRLNIAEFFAKLREQMAIS